MDLFKIDKIDKIFITFMFVVVTVVSICNLCFAAEIEDVETSTVSNIEINPNRNYFASSTTGVGYFTVEPGYVYHISNNSGGTNPRHLALSEEVPTINGTYTYLTSILDGETYDFIATTSNQYFYFDYSITFGVTVTREKVPNMNGAVNDLVDNVGFNQMWNVFENGIDFVGVIVLVAFGLFLIVLLIKKLSKGKSDF